MRKNWKKRKGNNSLVTKPVVQVPVTGVVSKGLDIQSFPIVVKNVSLYFRVLYFAIFSSQNYSQALKFAIELSCSWPFPKLRIGCFCKTSEQRIAGFHWSRNEYSRKEYTPDKQGISSVCLGTHYCCISFHFSFTAVVFSQ